MHIRQFDLQDGVEPLLQLVRSEYPEGEMSDSRFLSWEYLQNPFGQARITVAETDDEDVVGQYVVIPHEYVVDGTIVNGALSLNTLTRRDHRGKGLFTKMALQTYEESEARGDAFVLGFPNSSSYPGFVKKLGFHDLGAADFLVRPISSLPLLRGLLRARKAPKYRPYTERLRLTVPEAVDASEIEISDFRLDEDAASYEPFLAKRAREFNQTHRSIRYLQWRYREIPTRDYTLVKAMYGDEFCGYSALRIREVYGLKAVFIVDLNCAQDAHGLRACKTMLKTIASAAKAAGATYLGTMVTRDTPEWQLLRRHGFISVPKRFLPHDARVIIRSSSDAQHAPSSLFDLRKWFLTLGDYDAF